MSRGLSLGHVLFRRVGESDPGTCLVSTCPGDGPRDMSCFDLSVTLTPGRVSFRSVLGTDPGTCLAGARLRTVIAPAELVPTPGGHEGVDRCRGRLRAPVDCA